MSKIVVLPSLLFKTQELLENINIIIQIYCLDASISISYHACLESGI